MTHNMKNILSLLPFLLIAATAAEQPKNIVLILADDLGWADTTLYGKTSLYALRTSAVMQADASFVDG